MSARVLSVALPLPFQAPFTYRLPEALPMPERGARVLVPFGKRRVVGVALGAPAEPPKAALKDVVEIVDEQELEGQTFTEIRMAALLQPEAETKGKAQQELVARLAAAGAAVPVADLVRDHPSWRKSLDALVERGVVKIRTERRERSPEALPP